MNQSQLPQHGYAPRLPAIAGALVLILLVASGCSRPLHVAVEGDPRMNSGGNAAIVKIYQLSNDTNFRRTPIEAFWDDDIGTLGNELVQGQLLQVLLYPDEDHAFELNLERGTRFLGIAADLRQPERDAWRQLVEVGDLRTRQVRITIGDDRVSVESGF